VVADKKELQPRPYYETAESGIAADPVIQYLTKEQLQKLVVKARKEMEEAVKSLDFLEAARLRDELKAFQARLDSDSISRNP
jgi:excinuclease ABC subunit B